MSNRPQTSFQLPAQEAAVRRASWERLGALLSGLCLSHCLLVPVALMVLPGYAVLGTAHDLAHPVLVFLVIPVTLVALRRRRCSLDRSRVSRGLLLGGLLLVVLAGPAHAVLGETIEIGLTILGSLGLVAGHLGPLLHHQA